MMRDPVPGEQDAVAGSPDTPATDV